MPLGLTGWAGHPRLAAADNERTGMVRLRSCSPIPLGVVAGLDPDTCPKVCTGPLPLAQRTASWVAGTGPPPTTGSESPGSRPGMPAVRGRCAASSAASRGWRACARHDAVGSAGSPCRQTHLWVRVKLGHDTLADWVTAPFADHDTRGDHPDRSVSVRTVIWQTDRVCPVHPGAYGFRVPRSCSRIGVPGRVKVSRRLFTRYRW